LGDILSSDAGDLLRVLQSESAQAGVASLAWADERYAAALAELLGGGQAVLSEGAVVVAVDASGEPLPWVAEWQAPVDPPERYQPQSVDPDRLDRHTATRPDRRRNGERYDPAIAWQGEDCLTRGVSLQWTEALRTHARDCPACGGAMLSRTEVCLCCDSRPEYEAAQKALAGRHDRPRYKPDPKRAGGRGKATGHDLPAVDPKAKRPNAWKKPRRKGGTR